MIISTGMRTDIPACYSEWFFNRIREGFVLVRNPYNPRQVTRYRLDTEVVDGITFCTKNPAPMLERLEELSAFRQLWFVTITPYGREVEPGVPLVEEVLKSFRRLSEKLGNQSVIWRYDPVFITETYSLDFHIRSFARMAEALSGYTEVCVISFIDLYQKTKRNFPQARTVRKEERETLGKAFVEIGKRCGIRIDTCCEGTELARFGADVSGCMTKEKLEHGLGVTLDIPAGPKPPREGCGCFWGNDIGAYDTCTNGCLYCYACQDKERALRNRRAHDPASPFLTGGALPQDEVHEAKQKSWTDGQMSLFKL